MTKKNNQEKGLACSDYLSNEVQRVGRGFRRALDEVRRGKGNAIKSEIMSFLDCGRSQFYNYANGLKVLMPYQEEYLRQIFAKYDVHIEPFCDAYENRYCLETN